MSDTNDYSLGEDERNPGWMARLASGYVTNPPPRYRTEPTPEPTPEPKQALAPVRCCDCTHWRGRVGWGPVARKPANSARARRRCESFEDRAVEDRAVQPQERPVEPPPMALAPTQRSEPVERVRRRLVELGMLDRLQELVDIGGGNVGVRFRPGLSDLETAEVHGVIATAMLAAAMDDRPSAA